MTQEELREALVQATEALNRMARAIDRLVDLLDRELEDEQTDWIDD